MGTSTLAPVVGKESDDEQQGDKDHWTGYQYDQLSSPEF